MRPQPGYFLLLVLFSCVATAATFIDSVNFQRRHTEIIVFGDDKETTQIAIAPSLQGQMMSRTTGGGTDPTVGRVNREPISSGKVQPHVNRAVLVTGAGTGIGRKITERLAVDGYFVYAGARKESDIQALNAFPNVKALHLDVTDERDISAAVDIVAKDGRSLYALINNAGVLTVGSVLDTSQKEFDLVMDVNVRGPYNLTKAFVPQIIAQKGRIITIGSTSGVAAWANGSAYTMSKHAMEAFTDSLAEEMRPLGVQVSIIDPGNYKSEIGHAAAERGVLNSQLADRSQFKDPDDVAAAAELALSEPVPKRRYLVTPDETEAEWAIRRQIVRLVQLNEGQRYTFDRKRLIQILDGALAHARPRVP